MEFANKVVLVTGSSGGLGAVMAREFAKNGASVVITGRRKDAVESMAAECSKLSPSKAEQFPYPADVTNADSRKNLMDAIISKFGKLDVLVNNAGGGLFGTINDPKLLEHFQSMMDLNLYSVVAMTQLALPHLEKTKGSIVNLSSILATKPNQHFMPYCTAKAAMEMFSKSVALELGPKGIRVNLISPTGIRTDFAKNANIDNEPILQQLEQTLPMRRLASEEDVANAVLFLASDKSSVLTGVNIYVDGGHSLM